MRAFADWRLAVQLLTGSAVSLLLSIGLFGMGITVGVPSGTPLENAEADAGLGLLVVAVVLFLGALAAFAVEDRGQ